MAYPRAGVPLEPGQPAHAAASGPSRPATLSNCGNPLKPVVPSALAKAVRGREQNPGTVTIHEDDRSLSYTKAPEMGNPQPSPSPDMYIYCATSPSGKKYIGQTTRDVALRWREHVDDATNPNKDRCKALNNAIRKYGGSSFEVTVVAYCLPWYLDEYEAVFIASTNSLVPNGYNIKLGGSSGMHNEETKQKIRSKLIGKRFRLDTLQRRGNSKKRHKDLPMFVVGWYKNNVLHGYRVCNHPVLPERRFSLKRYEDARAQALKYIHGRDAVQRLHGSGCSERNA